MSDKIEYLIPQDNTDDELYYELKLHMDDEGDLSITDYVGGLFLSYAQAKALHFSLGQAIIRFDRAFGAHYSYELKEVTNG